MPSKDPYEVLGVSRTADSDEIKSAYRRMARRYHPDVNPNDPSAEEKFKEVGAAYSILSDPTKRARFDQTGSTDDAPTDPFFGGGNISDLFDVFFGAAGGGGGGRRRMGRDGEDIRVDLELTLRDVINGIHTEVAVNRKAECDACKGTGVEGGKAPETCSTCRGQGQVSTVRNTFIGQVRTSAPCPTCGGAGTVIKDPCKKCKGRAVLPETAKVSVNIPPGFEDGATLHVPGQGSDGVGEGRPGDLYVVLQVADDSRFQRHGQTLYTMLEATFAQAALGDRLEISGVDENFELTIPAGTQPGTQIAIRSGGLPPLHGGRRGDLVVQVNVKVPTKLSDAEAKLIRDFAELRGETLPKEDEKGGILGGLFHKKR
ncbi:MAG: molecular chaperone DnaJ [Fimbriimonas sp.]|nr:molecular chaperone DnaJ [Fimbriimonas sp.]